MTGLPVAEAIAIEPRLELRKYDPAGDLQALQQLAEWAIQFSPLVGLDASLALVRSSPKGAGAGQGNSNSAQLAPPARSQSSLEIAPESLLLDITGCPSLFGGEEAYLDLVEHGLTQQGWQPRVAIADTLGAAWALAHYGPSRSLAPPGQTEDALRPLPVTALRLPEETVYALYELGIDRINELMNLPRSSISSRLGSMVLERLSQALGHASEVLVPYRPPTEIEAVCPFEYPTDQLEVLSYALDRLTDHIHQALQERVWGALRLECWLYHERDEPTRIELGLSRPSRSLKHLRLLLHTRFETVAIPGPIASVRLCVTASAPLEEGQADLFDDEQPHITGELAALIDKLSSRLGREAVTSPKLVPDPQPEYACRFEPTIPSYAAEAGSATAPSLSADVLPHDRPMRLWPEPVPILAVSVVPQGSPVQFRWLGVEHRVGQSWGPERIETGWWRGVDVHRDYYIVETTEGARFWIFRSRDHGRWFLHGCFD